MNTMTWEEIDKDWVGLRKKHRMEIAQAVARYCIGHGIQEVSDHLGYSKQWLHVQLETAGIGSGIGGLNNITPLTGSTANVAKEVPRLVKEYGPAVTVKVNDDGQGNQTIATIYGDDAEAFGPYLDHYIEQGHEPAAATRLAKAEWAAEAAVEAGVIKETKNKRDEKVNQILFPKDAKDTFDLDLKMHMARVKSAAAFLDKANVRRLRSQATCEKVAEADAAWKVQAELVLQHYQPSMEN